MLRTRLESLVPLSRWCAPRQARSRPRRLLAGDRRVGVREVSCTSASIQSVGMMMVPAECRWRREAKAGKAGATNSKKSNR
jgi:hypothetical protein